METLKVKSHLYLYTTKTTSKAFPVVLVVSFVRLENSTVSVRYQYHD